MNIPAGGAGAVRSEMANMPAWGCYHPVLTQENALSTDELMNHFLAGVEKRAFRMAEIATGNREDALDILQDAMLALARRYAGHSPDDWAPLFHRILQNRIRDWHRRRGVKRIFVRWLGDEDDHDDRGEELAAGPEFRQPEMRLEHKDAGAALTDALHRLPIRQQQVFLLRAWEGFDVREAAKVMGCSEGSVKTHFSRAVARLRRELEDYYP